jgi:polygalacturonase
MSNRRDFIRTFIVGGSAVLLSRRALGSRVDLNPSEFSAYSETDRAWSQVPQVLKRIKRPVFAPRDFFLNRYGARGDGRVDSTNAFQEAIAACNKAGGGRVVVPKGNYFTGPIHLQSNVNLHLVSGATIKFSQDPKKYLPLVFTRWEGMELMNYSPFIYAFEQENIAITGQGTLDGQANSDAWWPWNRRAQYGWREGEPNQRKARTSLVQMIEAGVPVPQRLFGDGSYLRPQFIQPYRCRNVLIEGVTIRNSPMWEIHPVLCRNVTVEGVSISSHGPNNDGCDPESCTDVLIRNCYFDTGDDCIAIKSGRNADGRRLNAPAENIVIQGCQMKDGHGAITVGSEISGGVRNLFAEDCRLDSQNLDHALRVKNNAMRGGVLENLYFRDIEVGQVAHAVITIDFNYEEGDKGKFIPVVRNFVVTNLRSGKSKHALDVQGLTHAPVINLRLVDCVFDHVSSPAIVKNVEGLELTNIRLNGKVIKAFPLESI